MWLLDHPGPNVSGWAFKVQKPAALGVSARSEVTLHSGQLRAYRLLQLKQADGTFSSLQVVVVAKMHRS
jgi:hypothetical protein